MANTWPLICSDPNGESFATSTTRFVPVAGSLLSDEATISTESAWKAKAAYTIDTLTVFCKTHGGGTDTVVTLMVGGIAQSMAVTLTAAGQFVSVQSAISISVDDLVETRVVSGDTGATVITMISYELISASADNPPVISRMGSVNSFSSGAVNYTHIGGNVAQSTTDEVRSSSKIINGAAAPTFSKLTAFLGANSATADGTIKFRDDTVDGNQSLAILAGQTGIYEDASNTDAPATGSLVNYVVNVGTGGGWRVSILTMLSASYTARRMIVSSGGVDMTIGVATYFFSLEGAGFPNSSSTEAEMETNSPAGVIKNLRMYQRTRVGSHTVVGTLVVNGSDSALTATLDGAGAQTAVDESNSVSVSAGDDVSIKLVGATGTSSRVTTVEVEFEQAAAVAGRIMSSLVGAGGLAGAGGIAGKGGGLAG